MMGIRIRYLVFLAFLLTFPPGTVVASDESTSDSLSSVKPDSSRGDVFVLPIAFYSPQTKLAAGVLLGYMFPARPKSPSSNVIFDAYFTINNQFSTSVQPFFYWKQDLWRLEGEFTFQKWPDLFYGLGSTTSKDDEEEYTTSNIVAIGELQRRVSGSLYMGLSADFFSINMLETEEDGLLSRGIVRGSESHDLYGSGLSINRDTRDNVHFPTTGSLYRLSTSLFGGDYNYEELILDIRAYSRVTSDHVAAFQLYGAFLFGKPPFTVLPRLGETVRGHYPLRYIDRKLLAAQAEYRWPAVWKRFGLALFVGAGSVADDLEGFKDSRFKLGGGVGLRYLLFPREFLNIRLDIGFGGDGSEIYVDIDEAF